MTWSFKRLCRAIDRNGVPYTGTRPRAATRHDYLELPNGLGIGVDLIESEMERYPNGPDRFVRLCEEGWETRRRE